VAFKGWAVRSHRNSIGTDGVPDLMSLTSSSSRGSWNGSKRPVVAGRGGECHVVARRGTRRVIGEGRRH